jgi:hypothetical protein
MTQEEYDDLRERGKRNENSDGGYYTLHQFASWKQKAAIFEIRFDGKRVY